MPAASTGGFQKSLPAPIHFDQELGGVASLELLAFVLLLLQPSSETMEKLVLATASPGVDSVVKKLGALRSVYADLENLKQMLTTVQTGLDDAESRSITDLNLRLRRWLRKLGDAALDAEDVVEEFETEALRRRMEGCDRMAGKVRDFFSSNNSIVFRCKMASRIKEIRKRFDDIDQESKRFQLLISKSTSQIRMDRETSSLVDESEIYGRDEDEKEVMKFLIDGDNDKNISILPIFGLGGVGKTTLSQVVYNLDRVKEQFELRIWVCVGDDFDIKVLSQKMIEQVKGGSSDHALNLDTRLSFLQEKMRATKFLLVIDDLWIEKESEWDKWDRLKPLFNQAKLGSKIIITTRSENVARMTGTVSPYRLKELRSDDCWTIFRKRAYRFEKEEENPELVEIGKEIIKKCGGLPLAAKALGSLMSSKRGKVEWQAIRDDDIWKLSTDEIGILPTLKLSYDHLPSPLKRCFTYCSMFPKDYQFEIKSLIQLWMAEGLIDASDTCLHAEDIGMQYFNNLLQRSFFQDVKMDEYNNINRCKMHDLVHDLACSLTKDESWFIEKGKENIPSGCRYLSIVDHDLSSTLLKTIYEAKRLRSLVVLYRRYFCKHEFMFNVTKNLTQLHALDLNHYEIRKLSDRISRLKHLRLLDLSYTSITTLPTSITRLYNLQTLNLEYCYTLQQLPEGISKLCNLQTLNLNNCKKLQELPEDISNLINLRHLNISYCDGLSCMPRGLGRLSNLQTLGMFIVSQENGRTIKELQHLNYIQGNLKITDLQHVKDPNEAMQANLKAKTRLDCLKLQWKEGSDAAQEPLSTNVAEEVLERLRPHHNLKELEIYNYIGSRLPAWMSSSLSKLVRLQLVGLERCSCLLPLGRLPSLKKLTIDTMHAIRRIGEEFYGYDGGSAFPSLEELFLQNMPNLEEWDTDPMLAERKMTIFPRLIRLIIISCPKLTMQPCFAKIISIDNIRLIKWMTTPNLVHLFLSDIEGCDHLPALGQLPLLKQLTMRSMHAVRRIGDEFYGDDGGSAFLSLEKLFLYDMPNLEEWDTEPMTLERKRAIFPCLTQLMIAGCPKLTVQPCIPCSVEDLTIGDSNEGSLAGLSRLQILSIGICRVLSSSLSEWWNGLQCPTSLEDLKICSNSKLTCLPQGIMCLPSLHTLGLYHFKNLSLNWEGRKQQQTTPFFSALRYLIINGGDELTTLPEWIGGISSLHRLEIWSCPNLAMLPDGLRQLTTLQYLNIAMCPQLIKRCKRETGEDWHKIAHIPNINIKPEVADEEESNERCTFTAKFLYRFGFARCMDYS